MHNKSNSLGIFFHGINITNRRGTACRAPTYAFLCAILILTLSGCTSIYNPATGRNEMLLINTGYEINLGKEMDQEMLKKLEILHDPARQSRLDIIGKRLSGVSDRQDVPYSFKIVKDKELNAFAIPGGFIYVHSALMDSATDDELAAVVGHEIGHIAAKHSVKRLQAVMGYQLILNLALGASGRQNMAQAIDVVFNLVNLGFSRQDEYQADKLGVKYTRNAGFNPSGMVTFFQKLEGEANKKGRGAPLVFLSSHPPIAERIKRIQEQIIQ